MPLVYGYLCSGPQRITQCFQLHTALLAWGLFNEQMNTILLLNFIAMEVHTLLPWICNRYPSCIKSHRNWDYLTWSFSASGLFCCILSVFNYCSYHPRHDIPLFSMTIQLIVISQALYFLYLLSLIFIYYVICKIFNDCKPSPSSYPPHQHITSEREPFTISFLSPKAESGYSNIGMSILPGRQQAKNNRNLEMDLKRIINELNVQYLVTLVPNHQLAACNCSNLLSMAKMMYGTDSKILHYPIQDFVIPSDIDHFDRHCIQELVAQKRILDENEGNLLIHCYGGQGRTGIVVACLLMKLDQNIDLNKAISMMREARGPKMLTNKLQQQFCEVYYHYIRSQNRDKNE